MVGLRDIPGLGLEKAELVVVQGSPSTYGLKFKYNPKQLTLAASASWEAGERTDPTSSPEPSYQGTSPQELSLDIFFDAFEELRGDVTSDVATLLEWTKPCRQDEGPDSPPILELRWGSSAPLRGLRFYLSRVTATYTLFRMDGTPIRAECGISLIEYPTPVGGQNPTSGGTGGLHAHVLVEGETLQSVAWTVYRKAAYWRALAEVNDIDDPLRVRPGTRLLLPAARDARQLS